MDLSAATHRPRSVASHRPRAHPANHTPQYQVGHSTFTGKQEIHETDHLHGEGNRVDGDSVPIGPQCLSSCESRYHTPCRDASRSIWNIRGRLITSLGKIDYGQIIRIEMNCMTALVDSSVRESRVLRGVSHSSGHRQKGVPRLRRIVA